jgi:RNA polymerase sigma-70 factor (ECF subfamily)
MPHSKDAARPPIAPGAGPEAAPDLALVQALKRGCADAFETMVREHGRMMLATARRMLGTEDDARDALQEALLAAFRAIATFEEKSRLSTWLHRIVVNAALMRMRARRCRPECAIEDLLPRFHEDGHHIEPPCPWSGRAEQELLRSERAVLVHRAIGQLPPAYREVVVLRDIEGLSTEETGRVLGTSANAVKIRLHRARLALRTLLDRHFRESAS